MIYLRALKRSSLPAEPVYPLTVPLLCDLKRLVFRRPVTLPCGDNGSGKTTLMELLAAKVNAARIDIRLSEKAERFLASDRAFLLEMVHKPQRSFFFQAEDFVRYIDTWFYGEDACCMKERYGDLTAQSHGESFLAFFSARIMRGGLYLLDEPEAALSPANQLVLLHLVAQAEAEGCQLIISTHSPVLLAYPGACLYELRDGEAVETDYGALEHVRFLRSFLNDPEGYIGRLDQRD